MPPLRNPYQVCPLGLVKQKRADHPKSVSFVVLRKSCLTNLLRIGAENMAENFHLYFRTAWQLNMAERQAKHTTSVGFVSNSPAIGWPISYRPRRCRANRCPYLVPATKNSTQNT